MHHHRMAPKVEIRLTQALAAGRLTLVAAKLAGIEPNAAGTLVRYRRRGQGESARVQVDAPREERRFNEHRACVSTRARNSLFLRMSVHRLAPVGREAIQSKSVAKRFLMLSAM